MHDLLRNDLDGTRAKEHVSNQLVLVLSFGALLSNALNILVLSVHCFPSYCLLTPLMSPKDKKCKLID